MQRILIIATAFIFSIQVIAQKGQSKWTEYLSYSNGLKIAVAGQKVYCATEGGLFSYDLRDNSIHKITRVNGLSDFGIRTMAWSAQNNVLVVAYNNSNIDLVYENSITNLSDIYRKQMTGDMNIYNISFSGSEAYLSCGFGIVVVNLTAREIKDTWIIGPTGDAIRVNDTEKFGDWIYAATNNGLFRAAAGSSQLADYRNWTQVTNIPRTGQKYNHLTVYNEKLIANYTPDQYALDELFVLKGSNWVPYIPQIKYVHDIQVSGNYMTIASRTEAYIVEDEQVIGVIRDYRLKEETITEIAPRSGGISSDGSIWIADYWQGLIRLTGPTAEKIVPKGPADNRVFSLTSTGSDLWVTPGGRTNAWDNLWQLPRFHHLKNDQWTTYAKRNIPEMEGSQDIVEIAVNPSDPGHIFVASWGGGLLEFRDGEFVTKYSYQNSPLRSALEKDSAGVYVRVGGIAFDSQGSLWVTNSEVQNNLLKLGADGKWETFSLPEVRTNQIGKIIVTQNNDKWILVPRGNDAYVVGPTGAEKKRLQVTSYFNNGREEIVNRMNDVYSIAEDHEGAIWIGTSRGIAVYNSPRRVWEPGNLYAVQPSLDLRDGLYHPLLETETITALAVDGANRKWIGTRNSGVYLVSERGDKEVLHFTNDNSPLLSNNITALAINPKNGEVYIGTSVGLISYKGDAIAGNDVFADVYVYPNPVRETWDGPVTITGLVTETDVKITDISGNLVHQGTSLGGQAVWDGRNLNGKRVRTGIYLVFCTDKFGENTHVEKLLFIH
jgi:sugar lactone lactonase YvrE